MCVGTSRSASIKSLEGPKSVLSLGSFETAATLTGLRFDQLQLAIERVDLSRDVENAGVRLVISGDLGREPPVVRAAGQVHGLVVRRGLTPDGVDEPHREWLGGRITDVRRGGVQIVVENGVAFLAESAECGRDGAVAQFDIARLAHNVVGVGDDEVGESAVILLEAFGALCIGLSRHLRTEVSELLAELFNLGFGLEMLEGMANGRVGKTDGDCAQRPGVEFGMSLHDVEGALRGEWVVVAVDSIDDFPFFSV